MSVNVEKLEKNMAKLTIELSATDLEKSIQNAYNRQKSRISVPGFRKGKVPRQMIEKLYGPEVFYDEAARDMINTHYPEAADESGLDIVSRPDLEVTQIEKGEPFIFTALVAVKPEVKLGKYEGLSLDPQDTVVTDEDVEKEIERTLEANGRMVDVTDRPAANGDTAVIDYEGFCDGVAFPGGKGENHPLVIGSHTFIDGFEDQIIGHSTGEAFDITVTFPEEYHAPDLAGKEAVFKIKLNTIRTKEVPKLDDEYVGDVSEFETVAEFKENLKETLQENKKKEADALSQEEAVRLIVEDSEMEIPEPMIDYQIDSMIEEFAGRLMMQGLSLQQYYAMSGVNELKLREQMRDQALDAIKGSLVLEAIADEQKFEASESEVDEEIIEIAKQYYMGGDAETIKKNMSEKEIDNVKKDVVKKKALDYIIEKAKFRKTKKKAKKEEE